MYVHSTVFTLDHFKYLGLFMISYLVNNLFINFFRNEKVKYLSFFIFFIEELKINIYFDPALGCRVINCPVPLENDFSLIKGFLFAVRGQLVCLGIFYLMLVLRWKKLDLIM
jgi:hypothetical protein